MHRHFLGYTLAELLIVMALIAIISAFVSASLSNTLTQEKQYADLVQLGHTILYAKNYSISHNVKLSLCPSQDHLNCQDNWSQGAILFVDPKAELAPSRTDIIISLPALPPKAELLLKAFPKTSYLQFSPWGILNTDNGRFIYSLPNGKSQSLIFSKTGRIRFSNS